MTCPTLDSLLDLAMSEDLSYGDVTSEALFTEDRVGKAIILTRQPAVVSGLKPAIRVFEKIDPNLSMTCLVSDGEAVTADTHFIHLEGPVRSILQGERLALNFLQHLSGIATLTYQFVGAVSGTGAKIVHTRKTIPGLRHLAIEAVKHGGGSPHRKSLSHAILLKDNHIKACNGIQNAVRKLRENAGHMLTIEVECENEAQVEDSLEAGVSVILLDNMDTGSLAQMVKKVDGRATLEASGGITLKNVLDVARTGVDYISTSEITLSPKAIDIALDYL